MHSNFQGICKFQSLTYIKQMTSKNLIAKMLHTFHKTSELKTIVGHRPFSDPLFQLGRTD